MGKIGNPGRISKTLRCRVPVKTIEELRAIALELGCTWGCEASIGKLLETIARHPRAIAAVLKELEKRVDDTD